MSLKNPYATAGTARKVCQHAHSTNSGDGTVAPATVISYYEGAGCYAFALTEHDVIAANTSSMVLLPGNELSASNGHIVSLGSAYLRGAETSKTVQLMNVNIRGGVGVIAHPNYSSGPTPWSEIATFPWFSGVEIFNTLEYYIDTNGGHAVGLWDQILSGLRRNCWAFASDDFHSLGYNRYVGMNYLTVFDSTGTSISIMRAIEQGNFVANVTNPGVTTNQPTLTGNTLSVSCPGAVAVRFCNQSGLIDQQAGASGSLDISPGRDQYMRIEAVGQYTDTFDAGTVNDNTYAPWFATPGTWQISSGIMQNLSASTSNYRCYLRRVVRGDFDYACDVRVDNTVQATREAALMFLCRDSTYYYAAAVVPETGALELRKIENGVESTLVSVSKGLTHSAWYTVKVNYTYATNTIKVKVYTQGGGEPAGWDITTADTLLVEGIFGVTARYPASFDNLSLTGMKSYYQPVFYDMNMQNAPRAVGADWMSEGYHGYYRVSCSDVGVNDATFATQLRALGLGSTAGASGNVTNLRTVGARDYVVQCTSDGALNADKIAAAMYGAFGYGSAAAFAAVLTVTPYAGNTWNERRLACKTALAI